jgi:hypothetical protein
MAPRPKRKTAKLSDPSRKPEMIGKENRALFGIDTGTRGTYYFDGFESRRQIYIGP